MKNILLLTATLITVVEYVHFHNPYEDIRILIKHEDTLDYVYTIQFTVSSAATNQKQVFLYGIAAELTVITDLSSMNVGLVFYKISKML